MLLFNLGKWFYKSVIFYKDGVILAIYSNLLL